jgi:hypothetical protein
MAAVFKPADEIKQTNLAGRLKRGIDWKPIKKVQSE